MATVWKLEGGERYFAFTNQEKECFLYLSGISSELKMLMCPKELFGGEYVAKKNDSFLLRLSLNSVKEDVKPYLTEEHFDTSVFKGYLKETDDFDFSSHEVQKTIQEIIEERSNLPDLMVMPYFKAWFAYLWVRNNITYSMVPKETLENITGWITTLPKEQQRDAYSILSASFTLGENSLRGLAEKIILPEYVTDPFQVALCIMNQAGDLWDVFLRKWRGKENASNIIRNRMGKCSGMANVFVALCRSMGIPAMTVSGYQRRERGDEGHHRWAAIYLAPYGWIETDPTNGRHLLDFNHEQHCFKILPDDFPGTVRVCSREEVLSDPECRALCDTLSPEAQKKFFGTILEKTPEEIPLAPTNHECRPMRIGNLWF